MVTVSLSDVQSNSEHTQPDWHTLDIPQTPVESSCNSESNQNRPQSFGPGPQALQDAAKTSIAPVDEPPTPTAPQDKAIEDDMDWENLEKTEEQEPRGEGSDEVCSCEVVVILMKTDLF